MNLTKKKALAAKVLKVGKNRIMFVDTRLDEIKEAITRQDIVDLHSAGAIKVKDKKGRKKVKKRKHRRGIGKVKKKVKKRKQEYVKTTRKLRTFAKFLKKTGKINSEGYKKVRKKIRARDYKSKRHLNDSVEAQ